MQKSIKAYEELLITFIKSRDVKNHVDMIILDDTGGEQDRKDTKR